MTEFEQQQIYDLRQKGIGYKTIATVLGVSRDRVRGYCKRNGLDGNSKVEEQQLFCSCCGKPIKPKGRGRLRRFCSDECRRKWWQDNPQARKKNETAIYKYICTRCGREFSCYGNKKRKYCSHDCYIKTRFW